MSRESFTCRRCRRRVQCPRYFDPEDVNLCVTCENDDLEAQGDERMTREDMVQNAIEFREQPQTVFLEDEPGPLTAAEIARIERAP